jgi:S-adenosylmethionine:tRNA ribosyltransferase-isomerase
MVLRLSDFDYTLPEELIAQEPLEPRDAARLLVLERASSHTAHHYVRDLPRLLRPGDLLVANRSRVLPARVLGRLHGGAGPSFSCSAASLQVGGRPSLVPRAV